MWLAWVRPRVGGIAVLALAGRAAVALGATFVAGALQSDALREAWAVVLVPVLAGLLLLSAGRNVSRRGGDQPGATA